MHPFESLVANARQPVREDQYRLDVIIHIGRQKTGSTEIQARLSSIRDQLAPRGVLYSQAFGKKKAVDIKKVFIPGKPLRGRLEIAAGDSCRRRIVIQAVDVDRAEPWPDGRDRQEDQALPV